METFGELSCHMPLASLLLALNFAQVDWPPALKILHFGTAFNPRPIPPSAQNLSRRSSPRDSSLNSLSSPRAGRGGRYPKGAPGVGEEKIIVSRWGEFLPLGLEEIVFGAHFNQPVVS